ncbi:Vacuolar amino acid transporter 2 [Venturia inaequalis]|nr:Vacuolar amino acid transporter 2 [Venturia inaequalis]
MGTITLLALRIFLDLFTNVVVVAVLEVSNTD